MVSRLSFVAVFLFQLSAISHAQTTAYDSLKSEILNLNLRVQEIELNLQTSKEKFQSSILVATLGYTTTIAGGMMLGRKNDELGQALLIVGGTTGIIGTYKMVDAFRYLSGRKKRRGK